MKLFRPYQKLLRQLIRFSIAGISCFFIDFLLLYVLTDLCRFHYLLSAAISYTISIIVNYILSIRFVFTVQPNNGRVRRFTLFVLFSVISLGLTMLLMKFGVDKLHFNYIITKFVVSLIVTVFNYLTRKLSLEKLV